MKYTLHIECVLITVLLTFSSNALAKFGVCSDNTGLIGTVIPYDSLGECQSDFTTEYNSMFGFQCVHDPIKFSENIGTPTTGQSWEMSNIVTPYCPVGGGIILWTFCNNGNFNSLTCDDPTFIPKTLGNQPMCLKGNPVHPSTGNKFQIETDFTSDDVLSFTRFYNSMGDVDYHLGKGWSANYFQHLRVLYNDKITSKRMDGQGLYYDCTATGLCATDEDTTTLLEKTAAGYILTTSDDTVEQYDLTGNLLSITSRSGKVQTLNYNTTTALLETVTDTYGRTLTFTYDTQDRLIAATDPDGEVYNYEYDTNDNLIRVTQPDETPGNTTDNPTKKYQYNDINFPNHLTDIIDENSHTYASFGYDAQGRAIFTEHASGNERIDLVYNTDGTTTVTDSLGASNTYSYEITFGVPKTSTVSGSQCGTGCSGEGQAQTYDANGFLASRTDFEGNLTTFINNTRGLQESRTEAVGTPEERTITTEWHPDFRLPTKITEPGKETVFTYDTNGRLLSRTEREI